MTIAATLDLAAAPGRTWPVVVVGAGPAGALAAREIARRGTEVLLVDRAQFPRRKVCGCCLNARALSTLGSVGLGDLVARCGSRPLTEVRLGVPGCRATLPLPGGAVLSREALDAELVREAIGAGAAFLPGTMAVPGPCSSEGRGLNLRQDGKRADVCASLVLAADGLGSSFLKAVPTASRLGAGAVVDSGPAFYEDGVIHMACGAGGYAGLVRVEDGRLDVATAIDPFFVRSSGGVGPAVAVILEQVGWPAVPGLETLPWKGTPLLTRRPRRVAGERLLALGDAAGYVEPFTGEGMAWALSGARSAAAIAVEAAQRWRPSLADAWNRLHARAVGRRQHLARAAAWALQQPSLVWLVVRLLAALPGLASPVVRQLNAVGFHGTVEGGCCSPGP